MDIQITRYYEIFNKFNNNELIETKTNLSDAINTCNNLGLGHAVDVIIEMNDNNGENLLVSGNNIFSMQVYPVLKEYDLFEDEEIFDN